MVIVFLMSQKSYKPPKRPLTKKVCERSAFSTVNGSVNIMSSHCSKKPPYVWLSLVASMRVAGIIFAVKYHLAFRLKTGINMLQKHLC